MGGEVPEWWRSWAQAWLDHQRRRGRSQASLDTWAWALRDFGTYLAQTDHHAPESMGKTTLRGWQDRISIRLSAASQQVAITALRQLLRWADREGLSAHPGLGVWLEGPRVAPPLPRPLQPAHLAEILRWYGGEPPVVARAPRGLSGGNPDREWYRDRALFLFLLTSGCRISEALQLDREDVGAGVLVVRQKGGREHRLVPSTRAREWLADYLRRRGRDQEPALWIHTGPSGRPRRLTDEQANGIWRQLAYRLGIPRFTSHVLRHTAATELLEAGASELDVQQQLGHASLATVHRYAKVRERRRRELADRLDALVPEQRPAVLKPINRRRRRRA